VKIYLKDIGEKEDFQDQKNNKKFDQDNNPESFTHGHTPETIEIEAINFVCYVSAQYRKVYLIVKI